MNIETDDSDRFYIYLVLIGGLIMAIGCICSVIESVNKAPVTCKCEKK